MLVCVCATASVMGADGYQITKKILVPGQGGWDYLTVVEVPGGCTSRTAPASTDRTVAAIENPTRRDEGQSGFISYWPFSTSSSVPSEQPQFAL